MNEALLPLSICVAIGLLWYAAMRARELAIAQAGRLCARYGAQMLDQSVALHRLRPLLRGGRPRLARSYRFELSYAGDDRHRASLTMVGDRLVDYSVPTRDEYLTSPPIAAVRRPADFTPGQPPIPATGEGNVVPITRARRTLH
ncbi:MAG TPA: DUF3301 domain-containing protein [Rhodanobacteraceae bacterium]|nr:DUF3301 domain-containing protein [Rhodanobacteraceae bacterium]